MASNQFFDNLPGMGIEGKSGGNPSGLNFSLTGGPVKDIYSGTPGVGPGSMPGGFMNAPGKGSAPNPYPTFNFGGDRAISRVRQPPWASGGGDGGGGGVGGVGGRGIGTPGGVLPKGGGGGSNPGISSPTNPYQVPGSQNNPQNFLSPYYQSINGGQTIAPQYPSLSGTFASWLQSMIGQGVTPFNLSTPLPTGGSTQPGQLTAPALQDLTTIAQQGISALPEWQAMVAAMQDPIAQQTANLREQFASLGDIAGSPFANAMSNFGQQTALQQESLLGQLQQQNILQGQIPVSEFLQNYNQQAIQNQYGEFIRTQPQYNPLIGDMLSMSQQYPPTIQTGSGMGALGGLLSGLGGLAGAIPGLINVFKGLGGGGSNNPGGNIPFPFPGGGNDPFGGGSFPTDGGGGGIPFPPPVTGLPSNDPGGGGYPGIQFPM